MPPAFEGSCSSLVCGLLEAGTGWGPQESGPTAKEGPGTEEVERGKGPVSHRPEPKVAAGPRAPWTSGGPSQGPP